MSHDHETPPTADLPDEILERLDEAWELLEHGDADEAGMEAEDLTRQTRGHPEARFLLGAVLLDLGDPREALKELRASEGKVSDPELLRYYIASTLYELARFEEAEAILRPLREIEEDQAAVEFALAEVLEHLGRTDEAEESYRIANRLDEEAFPMPMRMPRAEFDAVVAEATASLPEDLRNHLKEVAIVVEDLPRRALFDAEAGDTISPSLLGLFVGSNLRDESVFDLPGLPRTIFVYQRNLERECRTREELVRETRLTVFHELGHYLGLEEEELEARGLE
jgi:predicted Zn-dependent protease with MMP-like domain